MYIQINLGTDIHVGRDTEKNRFERSKHLNTKRPKIRKIGKCKKRGLMLRHLQPMPFFIKVWQKRANTAPFLGLKTEIVV